MALVAFVDELSLQICGLNGKTGQKTTTAKLKKTQLKGLSHYGLSGRW